MPTETRPPSTTKRPAPPSSLLKIHPGEEISISYYPTFLFLTPPKLNDELVGKSIEEEFHILKNQMDNKKKIKSGEVLAFIFIKMYAQRIH